MAIRSMGTAAEQRGFHPSSEIKTRLVRCLAPEFEECHQAWCKSHGIEQVAPDPNEAAAAEEETREQGEASAGVANAMLSAGLAALQIASGADADDDDIQMLEEGSGQGTTPAPELLRRQAEEAIAANMKIAAALLAAPAEASSIPAARVEPDALALAEASSRNTSTESAPEEVQSKPRNVWEIHGLPWLSAVFPTFGDTMPLPAEVRAAIKRGNPLASEQDAVPMARWFPELDAWAAELNMDRTSSDPDEGRFDNIQFFLAEMELHWHTLNFEPARVFSAKICADLGASDLQWFGSFWYGLSMPDSDIDFMPILSSSAKKRMFPRFCGRLLPTYGAPSAKTSASRKSPSATMNTLIALRPSFAAAV